MEQVNIRIGPVAFDHADYDAKNDVLYLHVGEPREAEGEETRPAFRAWHSAHRRPTRLGCSSDPWSRWRTAHRDSGVGQGERR